MLAGEGFGPPHYKREKKMKWVNTRVKRNMTWANRHMANAQWYFDMGDERQALKCLDHAQEFLTLNKGIIESAQAEKRIKRER